MNTLKRMMVALQSSRPEPNALEWGSKSSVLLLAVVFAHALLLSGCSDSSTDQTPTQNPPVQSQTKAGGVWTGTWTDDLTAESFAVWGVVRDDNEEGLFVTGVLRFVLRDIGGTDGEMWATIEATYPVLSGTFQDGSMRTSGVLTGLVVERERIEGTWSLDSGDTGTMTLHYDDVYERGSDIARLAGTWECWRGWICNIDALGEIFGQGDDYCPVMGQVEIIDPLYNVYDVTYGNPCSLEGIKDGLGVLADGTGTNDVFIIMVDPGSFSSGDYLVRQ